ncbi:unnamed protein product [Closterium sp. NIES-65]|nr:unnamed protein product [Closterium sp. NIES-65]
MTLARTCIPSSAALSKSLLSDKCNTPPAQPTSFRLTPRADASPSSRSVATNAMAIAMPAPTSSDYYSGYPTESLPPTPVFPSNQAMSQFLQSYGRMLQHVQANGRNEQAGDALVSGDSLAAAGATVVERVHLGLNALLGHPVHGVQGGQRWCEKEMQVERCLAELEKDIDGMRSAHERPPRAATLTLATAHCYEAARLIRTL